MTSCQRCRSEKSAATVAQSEVRRLARLLARRPDGPGVQRWRGDLAEAKRHLAEAKAASATPHGCDDLLATNHWTKGRP